MGITRSKIETGGANSMKGKMYTWQSKASTAQDDFNNNTAEAFGYRKSDGKSWSSIATADKTAVVTAQTNLSTAKDALAKAQIDYQNGVISDADFQSAQTVVSNAESALTKAQQQQQTDYAAYNDYVRVGAAKAESTYKKGLARYQKHGRKDDGLTMFGDSSVGARRKGP